MKLFPLILSLAFCQFGYSIEHIESTAVSPKPEEFPQEYQADTTSCQNFLQPYTRLMKEGSHRLYKAGKSVKEEAFRRDLSEKDHNQILISKIAILGHHIRYLENVMGTIEASDCFSTVNSNLKKVNIVVLFARTRTSLQDFSSKISKGLQELEQTPTSTGVYKLLSSIFNGDRYDTIQKDVDMCLQVFEAYLENHPS